MVSGSIGVSGDSGAPRCWVTIPIGENISSRPFHIASALALTHSPFPKESETRRKTHPDASSHVHSGPLTTTTTLSVLGANLHHPSSAPRFSAIPHCAPVHIALFLPLTHLFPTFAFGDRWPQTPSTTLSSQHRRPSALAQIALWGSSP